MNKPSTKYKVIDLPDWRIIITEYGGVTEIHYADEMNEGDERKSTTEFYHKKIDINKDYKYPEVMFEELGEGDMSYENHTEECTHPYLLMMSLIFLCPENTFVKDNTILPHLNKEFFLKSSEEEE